MNTLIEKLTHITGEIGAIPKTKKKDSGVNYAFRGIDDIMNALNPLLAKYGVTMRNKVLSHTYERIIRDDKKVSHLATVLLAVVFSDGTTEEVTEEIAMSIDYSDKAYTQAMSMGYKYALLRKFCIPTEDLEDPDNGKAPAPPAPGPLTPKGGTKTPAPPKPKEKKKIVEMVNGDMTKEWANTLAKVGNGSVTVTQVMEVYELTTEQEKKLREIIPTK